MLQDLARMMDIEFVHISADSKVEAFEKDLMFADLAWKLR
jgi:L-arabinose isomerase